ncbi:MAG: helix-turn-helix transcriptional regulator [Lachnospiraceae bacterium]|nr:helix-turn-helix transcriptional regulator [Lachnospiraceae bacterium]
MRIWEKIFDLIRERGMTQKEFSGRTGIAESTISDWKRKGLNPSADKLPAICHALGVSVDELLGQDAHDYNIDGDIEILVEKYRNLDPDMRAHLVAYLDRLQNEAIREPATENVCDNKAALVQTDKEFQIRKDLARRLRRLSRLNRLKLDESEHASGINLHLFGYLDFLGLDKLDFIKDYLSHIQPYMISEIRSQERFDNAICVLDEYYRISVYIKVDATKGEEVIVSFHENNKGGIAKRNLMIRHDDYVYVFADSIGSHVEGTDNYSINLFIMRGVRTFPLNIAAVKYDNDGFLVRASSINNALVEISNRYLEDLYTSDLDFSGIDLFSSLQQLSFTSFGNDVFSNISLLIDSLIIQKDTVSRQIADAALCIYCGSISLRESDMNELIDTLRQRFSVNSVKVLPQILERVELNIRPVI